MPTYKKEYPTLVEDILTDCDIYSADGHKFHADRALWDTGADTTIISSRIVKELNLQPYKAGGISGIGGATGSNVYLVHVLTPTGVTAVSMIAYVGSDNGEASPYNHGLALATSDANGGNTCQWKTSQSSAGHTTQNNSSFTSESGLQYNDATHNSDTYPAFKAAIANNGIAVPTGCSAWSLASAYQWSKMGNAAGGLSTLKTNAGMQSSMYWSSSEYSTYSAWDFGSSFYSENKTYNDRVRSCLAF